MTIDDRDARTPGVPRTMTSAAVPRQTSRDLERYAGLFAARTRVMKSSAMRDLMALTERGFTPLRITRGDAHIGIDAVWALVQFFAVVGRDPSLPWLAVPETAARRHRQVGLVAGNPRAGLGCRLR